MTGEGGDAVDRDAGAGVDWEAADRRSSAVSRRTAGFLAGLAGVAAAFGYDYAVADVVGLTRVDWLFGVALLALCAYAVVPLAATPARTRRYWRRLRRDRAAAAGLGYLLGMLGVALVGPAVVPAPDIAIGDAFQPPVGVAVDASVPVECLGPVVGDTCYGTLAHPLGTTRNGMDVLALVVYGARTTMEVALVSGLLVVVIATAVGTVAATAGGLVDEALMRYVDLQQTFPVFVLYLLLVYLLGGSLFLLVLIFGLTSWGGVARLVRSAALQRREEGYVAAARLAGADTGWVVRRHVVPNVAGTVITATTLLVPQIVLAEAGLAFLGIADQSVHSWGRLVAAGRGDLSTAWWISTIPGVFLLVTVLAFNFLGDGLDDALDPRGEA